MPLRALLAFASLVSALACTPARPLDPAAAADLVLVNGNVLTVDAEDRVAEAVAVKGARIMAVGTTADIEALAGPATVRVDLRGQTVTPGLIDAHAHFGRSGASVRRTVDVAYPTVRTIADIVRQVAERVKTVEPGTWIQGRGWDEGKLGEHRYVHAADLDPVSPSHPVVLMHTTGHYAVANSVALAAAGIARATPDPPGGTIDRAADGTPTGVLKEGAQRLVTRLVPPLTSDEMDEGVSYLASEFNKEGMTAVKDPGIGLDMWESYQRVHAAGGLPVRVFALWRTPDTVEEARALAERIAPFTRPYLSTGDDELISGGVKLFIDGSGGARTAWMYDEWNRDWSEVDRGNYGYPTTDPEIVRQQIRLYHDAGLHVSVHSIGDRGIDWVVDSIKLALDATPVKGRRHGIIHANLPSERALDQMAAMQRDFDAGYPEPSASFLWWIGDNYAGNFGPSRAPRVNPFKTYVSRGIRWAGSSDFSVTPFAARYGIWASVARETLLGVHGATPFGLDEAVDVRTALRSFTIWGAHQLFLENEIGSIEPGKYADLAVWDTDLYTAPTPALKEMRCLLTLMNGRIVHEASDSPLIVSR
jgi:hypothetical protein